MTDKKPNEFGALDYGGGGIVKGEGLINHQRHVH